MNTSDLNSKISTVISSLLKHSFSRNIIEPQFNRYLMQKTIYNEETQYSPIVRQYEYYALWSMYKSFARNLDKGNITSEVTRRMLETLLNSVLLRKSSSMESMELFRQKNGIFPPTFLTISPTKKCNLKCEGCYAASSSLTDISMSWTILNRIIDDSYSNMGVRFFVISGGEPLLYKSENKTILDLFEKWNDCFFLMYTNGTLITEDIAIRLANLGNVTPAISIEGFEKETDKRRGEGIYTKITKARQHLTRAGVPFGLSVTATQENIDLLLDEAFYDYYFQTYGCTHMWVFQYMPIGRDFTSDLMISPEQRLQLFKIQSKVLTEKNFFVADFWNSALMSNGCISFGKSGGYIYINWDGNIMPCVFIPYYTDNVYSLYESGKTLADALFSPFFVKGREWQTGYVGQKIKSGNLLRPCFYRDHYKTFFEIAKNAHVTPENLDADKALDSKAYYEFMTGFDKELEELALPVWKKL